MNCLKIKNTAFTLLVAGFVIISHSLKAQGYLKTEGKKIINGQSEEVILRGMGLGGWMLQEGYMLQTQGFAGAQYQIKQKITDLIGADSTQIFYDAWLNNYLQKKDIDSLASWGFNCIRLPMHYNLFTLAIEDEPVAGQNTWLETGVRITDSLLSWCSEKSIYLILDLHAAPGGQGYDQGIADYNPEKPSLWESEENREKMVALWKNLAERYANEEWIGGYDLLNEPNWNLSGNNMLRDLYYEITDSIRAVDTNHIIFIEGNWFANDFTGLTPPWDDNMVYSFHKYATFNDNAAIQWMLDIRNNYNIPIWLGESGENSNNWYTECINSMESNNIGWSWWTFKKVGSVTGPYTIEKTSGYDSLLNYWQNNTGNISSEYGFNILMNLTDKLRSENCLYHKDVTDAMFRQVSSDETLAFINHSLPGIVNFTDFDLGKNGLAYNDEVVANFQYSTGSYEAWNTGWVYRNDGVDIQQNTDTQNSNGYNVGWTNTGEWMQYTLTSDSIAGYTLEIRSASVDENTAIHFEMDGVEITPPIYLPYTGDWQNWASISLENIIIPAGTSKIRAYIDQPSPNLSYFRLYNPVPINEVDFQKLTAKTSNSGNTIYLTLNKAISGIDTSQVLNDFKVYIDNIEADIISVSKEEFSDKIMQIELNNVLLYNQLIQISYNGNSIVSGSQMLQAFENLEVDNLLGIHYEVPGRIEAEDFMANHGMEIEDCLDSGEGYDMGYADAGDYLDYKVYIKNSGLYRVDYRLATEADNSIFTLKSNTNGSFQNVDTIVVENTGGWQTWNTQRSEVVLHEGLQTLRIYVQRGPFNLNWFRFGFLSNSNELHTTYLAEVYPNPSHNKINIHFKTSSAKAKSINILSISGETMCSYTTEQSVISIPTNDFKAGVYLVQVFTDNEIQTLKLIIN